VVVEVEGLEVERVEGKARQGEEAGVRESERGLEEASGVVVAAVGECSLLVGAVGSVSTSRCDLSAFGAMAAGLRHPKTYWMAP